MSHQLGEHPGKIILVVDTQLDGYRIDLTKEQIEGAPSYADDDDTWYNDNGRRVYDYYGVPPYWM